MFPQSRFSPTEFHVELLTTVCNELRRHGVDILFLLSLCFRCFFGFLPEKLFYSNPSRRDLSRDRSPGVSEVYDDTGVAVLRGVGPGGGTFEDFSF